MNFVFTEKKMSPSDDLRAYAQKKISKLDKLFRSESTAYVTFTVERNRNIAEVTVHSGGMYYRVTESTNSMYVSIVPPRRSRRGARGGVPCEAHEAFLHQAHERGRGHPADEPAGAQLLCLQEPG